MTTLDMLRPGETGVVRELRMADDRAAGLARFGLVPGAEVSCSGRSPLGDPACYVLRGTVLALRASDTRRILVRRREKTP